METTQSKAAIIDKIFVGKPKTLGNPKAKKPFDREWTTAIFKEPVQGAIYIGKTNLTGDQQADLRHHGGPEKAVFSYPSEHYFYWQKELNKTDIQQGGMGENFSTINILESDVAIGDTFEIGQAIVQVSQPRQPCWKPARRFRTKEFAVLSQNTGRTGWYYRVLQEGYVEPGQTFTLIDRPFPKWTVEKSNFVMHEDRENFELIEQILSVDALASNWQATFQKRLENRKAENIERRVYGPNVDSSS